MKILHTADWHIGKVLHKHPMQDEIVMFFDWLVALIKRERVDVLMISGDVFDIANPSAADKTLYYSFLRRLYHLDITTIITGGNHDSVGFLNAPAEPLLEINAIIVGGATEDIKDEIIEIKNEKGNLALVIAAVPFLRDKDLRSRETDAQYANRTEAIKAGIAQHYKSLADICESEYPGIPSIAMGHLYTVGADASESERDIHVGNAAAVDSSAFPESFNYVALGHIHRPQRIQQNDFIRYSGSPIALSFSEKEDRKSVIILDLVDGQLSVPQVVEVPKVRELRKFSGSLLQIKDRLKDYNPDFDLVSFVELDIHEEEFSSVVLAEVEELKQTYVDHPKFKILKGRTTFKTGTKDTSHLFTEGEMIEDLAPIEVFSRMIENEPIEEDRKSDLKDTFQELLDLVAQSFEA